MGSEQGVALGRWALPGTLTQHAPPPAQTQTGCDSLPPGRADTSKHIRREMSERKEGASGSTRATGIAEVLVLLLEARVWLRKPLKVLWKPDPHFWAAPSLWPLLISGLAGAIGPSPEASLPPHLALLISKCRVTRSRAPSRQKSSVQISASINNH